ncbi:MAG: xanthine dehydrogenase family protein subunit M [Alphaproteobacteria bacterium]
MSDTRFHAPASIDEAVRLLAADDEARPLAGGQTLVAMLNADLMSPSALVSLHRIEALRRIGPGADGALRIGAMTTHAALAESRAFAGAHRLVAAAAGRIGHAAIRNQGTIGGAVAHADPSADYPPALVALDAVIEAAGPNGRREIPTHQFFEGFLTTALQPGEIVTAIVLPPLPPGARVHYEKFARVEGDFATVSVALALWLEGSRLSRVRVAFGGVGPVPVRSIEAEERLLEGNGDEPSVEAAGAMLTEASDPIDDVRASAAYRRLLVPRLLRRALRAAQAKEAA